MFKIASASNSEIVKELMKRHEKQKPPSRRKPPTTTRFGYRGGKFVGDLMEKQAHGKGQG